MTEEQKLLVENNHKLIYSFLHNHNLDVEEFYDVAAIGLCKAAISYSEDKSKFSTFAYKCMQNSVFMEIRKETFAKIIPANKLFYYFDKVDEDAGEADYLDFLAANEQVEDYAISNVMLSDYLKTLKDIDKKIIKYLSMGLNQNEVAGKCGCSQANVSRVKKKLESAFNY